MKKLVGVMLMLSLLFGCAHLEANRTTGEKLLTAQKLMVFPFRNPYYNGKELTGIGDAFSVTLMSEIQIKGWPCELAKSQDFSSQREIAIDTACSHGKQNKADIAILGVITEWIDGATNWSGVVDVAAVTVSAYTTEDCKLKSSVSGRQNGTWWTLVNAPTTRFLKPLSQEILRNLLE